MIMSMYVSLFTVYFTSKDIRVLQTNDNSEAYYKCNLMNNVKYGDIICYYNVKISIHYRFCWCGKHFWLSTYICIII